MVLPADSKIILGYVIYDATNNLYVCRRSLAAITTFNPIAMLYDTARGAKLGLTRMKKIAEDYKLSSPYWMRISQNSYMIVEMSVDSIHRTPV